MCLSDCFQAVVCAELDGLELIATVDLSDGDGISYHRELH